MEIPYTTQPTDTASLQAKVKNLCALVYNKEVRVQKLQEQLDLQNQHRYGSSSERTLHPQTEQLEWDFFMKRSCWKLCID